MGQIQVALLNSGTVRASGSSGLAVNQGITGPTGTIEIATNGILTLGGATESNAGTLIHNGAAANSLNLGNNNITVYTDYTNANFGTGNSFNARANIAVSSGQILAAGTPAQAQVLSSVNLLGRSSLTNGNTATPTPTIGNVHVGSTKLTYQIANNNVGGPAIRGAIQTTVGGANITDGQLSGSGVTAGNFGPIAAGSNATFGVTFNPASAGPLTPASGQVVRIANNFDNVTDQNMSIVLGSGAAAYNLAAGNATPSPVLINNQRVGGSPTQALTVSNTVPSGSFTEVLNASFGANTGAAINNGGSITGGLGTGGVAAGGPDNSMAMSVGVDTTTAGAKSGTVRLNYVSNGTGTSGLGNTNVGSQIITVSGNVYQVAQPSVPTSADLGNVHVGTNPTQAITIGNTNISPQNFQEGLNVAVGGTTGGATGSGSITNLAAGSTSTAISVGLNNAAAGNQSGSVAVNLETNGSGTSGLASQALPQSPASVTVQATGYRLAAASAHTPEPVDLGNIRVGGSLGTQMLSVQNTAANDDFSENLNASIGGATGGASASGSFNLLAPQATNGTGLVVGLGNANTNVAGAKTGTATISFVSDGTDTSGLGQTPLTGQNQTVNVSGNVYQPAAGQLNTPTSLNFGTVQVGQAVSQNLSISNVATGPANFVEDLNARFGATSGTGANLISGTGSITGLTAGNTNASSMTVNVKTNAAAAINGAIGVNFFTAGAVNGVSNGLGELGVGSADFGMVGTIQTAGQVVDQAKPVINTPSINLGNVRINTTSPTQFVSVTNQATGNPQAAMNASISAVAPITASGSFTLLAPGGTNNDTLQVGMSTATAGAINSTATVAFVSDASIIGGCGSNCQMNLPSQDVNVTGNIYRLAKGSVASPVDIGAARVGIGTLAGNLSVTNTAANDGFSEKLNASITGTTPAVIGASGQVLGLAAGQTNSSSLQVTLDNSTAGAISGTAMVQFKSDGTGIDNGSQSLTVTGKIYTPAVANILTSSPVDFGIVHVGDTGPTTVKSVAVQNGATATALNDVLIGSIGAGGAPFSGNSDLGAGLGPQASSSALQVNLDATKAGIYTGSANLSLASHDADLSDLSLTTNLLALMAQANLYAALAFLQQGGQGSLTGGGNSFVLDFGNVLQNSSQEALLAFLNDNPLADQAFTDLLSSTGAIISGSGFTIPGDSVSDLLGGVSQGGFHVAFDASDLGSFLETLSFDVKSSNPSGFNGFLGPVTFTIEGDVVASGPSVPEPGTLSLLGTGLILIGVIGYRRRHHRR